MTAERKKRDRETERGEKPSGEERRREATEIRVRETREARARRRDEANGARERLNGSKTRGKDRDCSLYRRVNMCNLDTVRCERGGSTAFLLERRRGTLLVRADGGARETARDEDGTERRPRAIWSRKLAMYAVSLHNRKLSVERERDEAGEKNEVKREKRAERRRDTVALHLQRVGAAGGREGDGGGGGGGDEMTRARTHTHTLLAHLNTHPRTW